MSEGKQYLIEDWWTGSQIELVKDSVRVWKKQAFKSTSGFWTHVDGGKILSKTSQHDEIPGDSIRDDTAWDHEHCELCFETISDHGDYQREGYTDESAWICFNCYNKYIATR